MGDNGANNWNVAYSAIRFLEQVLSNHRAVESFERSDDIRFTIRRRNGLPIANAVLVDQYEFGVAAFYEVLEEFKDVNVIVNNGNWNHIAFNWRELFKNTGVAVFSATDFMGALNVAEFEQYVPRDEREGRSTQRRKSS
jgi:hypothetical protein